MWFDRASHGLIECVLKQNDFDRLNGSLPASVKTATTVLSASKRVQPKLGHGVWSVYIVVHPFCVLIALCTLKWTKSVISLGG